MITHKFRGQYIFTSNLRNSQWRASPARQGQYWLASTRIAWYTRIPRKTEPVLAQQYTHYVIHTSATHVEYSTSSIINRGTALKEGPAYDPSYRP